MPEHLYEHIYVDRSNTLYENDLDHEWVILGVPFDSTETFCPGQRFGPNAIREVIRNKDAERKFDDIGNLICVHGSAVKTLNRLEEVYKYLVEKRKKIILLGGEHTITLPPLKVLSKMHKEIQIVVFDAHYDLKDNYEGEKLNHSTVMRRIHELGNISIIFKGVRRYDEEEKQFYKKIEKRSIKRIPTYISIDLDYFDASLAPGCSDKEFRGYSLQDFLSEIKNIYRRTGKNNIIGIDIVELNPLLDTSKQTSTLAAEVLECLMCDMHEL